MALFLVGQSARDSILVEDSNSQPADPGTTPTCLVTLPDGTTSAVTVTHPSTGNYTAKLLSTIPGIYLFFWSASGSNSDGFPFAHPQTVIPITSAPLVEPADLGTYLGSPVDTARAALILQLAQQLCETICTPLPAGATAVVLDVAARAYSNAANADSEVAGPFNTTFGAVSGGMWLTRENKAALRRLNGGSGAFTIDTMPATAGQNLSWWNTGNPLVPDWDTTP